MQFFKAIIILAAATYLYVYLISTGILTYANIAFVIMTFALTSDSVLYSFNRFWFFLYDNSFCPWLMVFNKRKNNTILTEASNYIYQIKNENSILRQFELLIEALTCYCELFMGPAIGIFLAFLQIFISYKSGALVLNKLFSRK